MIRGSWEGLQPGFHWSRSSMVIECWRSSGIVFMHIVLTAGEVQSGDGGLRATFVWGSFGQLVEVLFVISGFVVYLPTIARGGDVGNVRGCAI